MWLWDGDEWRSGTNTLTPPVPLDPQPSQPALHVWGPTAPDLSAYAYPGAMVSTGRVNYGDSDFVTVCNAGGTVLFYFDPIIDYDTGGYYEHAFQASSSYGAAVPRWPGEPHANDYGYLNDFRTEADGGGGVAQAKIGPILTQFFEDYPHIDGIFLDDVGSRSYFADFNWDTWGSTYQQNYRNGAIAICQTVRDVCDMYNKICIVNGTWMAGTLAANGGGYPTMSTHGCSLADGGVVEHHASGEVSFWTEYTAVASSQWATESLVTDGVGLHMAVQSNSSERAVYAGAGTFAWISEQAYGEYGTYKSPWGAFHAIGLPWE